ncbi:MAG: hypothetical protein ABI867_43435 [Kofleriaceae bacterium]
MSERSHESFVDLTYRGLSLGRRIKLTRVRPSTGYLEHPMPMPVGTAVAINTDDNLVFDAIVTDIHEQVGGSENAPGMTVTPALADDQRATWWRERVTLPELEAPKPPERAKQITVRPRSHTIPTPPPADAIASDADLATTQPMNVEAAPVARVELVKAPTTLPPPISDTATRVSGVEPLDRKTSIMNAVDQDLLEQISRTRGAQGDQRAGEMRRTGEHEVVDDGQRTTIMDAIDPTALGLDLGASGSMPAIGDDEEEDDSKPVDTNGDGSNGDANKPKGTVKRRKKRR